MASGTFSKDDFEKMNNELARMHETQQKITNGIGEYNKHLKKVGELQANINHIQKTLNEGKEEEVRLEKELAKAKPKERAELKKQLAIQKAINDNTSEHLETLNESLKAERELLSVENARKATWSSMKDGAVKFGKAILNQKGYLLEQQKALKTAELSMGILSNQSGVFRKNLIKTSHSTNLLGVDTKKLAEMQTSYSDQIGRAVVLSSENLTAMAELSSGTMLGAQGATEMAAQMELFGKSAKATSLFVEEIMNSSNEIGLNSDVVLKNVNKGLKSMNRLSFKGGTKAMAEMAKNAALLGYEMSSIEGVADKLFNPEGAVEMAAQLQVLGGEWSKLADPFTLMYQARNAPEELAKSLYEAAGASAHFNEKTKEFEIGAMELHRLKEVAKATGQNYEELAVSAKKFAKLQKIKGQIGPNIDEKTMEYIANTADMKDGKFTIQIEDKDGKVVTKSVEELGRMSKSELQSAIKDRMEQKASLKERAIQAQTFDETFTNIINQFKSTLLPAFEGFAKGLEAGLGKFNAWAEKNDIFTKLSEFSEKVGKLAASILKFVVENPITTLLGIGLFKAAQWMANGAMLGLGFNKTANVGGGGIGSGPNRWGTGGASSGLGGQGFGKDYRAMRDMGAGRLSSLKEATKLNKWGAGAKMGAGIGLGLAGTGLSYGSDALKENGHEGWGKAAGVGAAALQGAGMGMMFGPWGAAIGGALGAGYGVYDQYFKNSEQEHQDFIMRPGQGATPFTSKDTLIGLKDGGPIEKSFGKENMKASGGKMEISFSPIKIEGSIKVTSNSSSMKLDLDKDPILAREITRIVHESTRKAIGGGTLNPNVA